ncbi:YfbM family protein [Labedaea rhizosphaerae]|uniref:Uncharacterized protein DUF1877 n=1 Tax=Labedaea rhizosphaerae TaxID=598644 RepID=A0A4R6SQ65_LABRH|nr:YfbM family protein [Labedaea rhizosphaerae]TDQ05750.1 uncharacterized protein DUF1877 [Labedaea rhizosphaerae]
MGGIGVHFALTAEQATALLEADDPAALMDLVGAIEESADDAEHLSTDKAWDAIHRCLSDGTLTLDAGEYPLSHTVLGGEPLDAGDDYFVSHLTPEQVKDVAVALGPVAEDWLRERFFALDPEDYDGARDDEDFAYTWSNFTEVRDFFTRAAGNGRAVIFTVEA